MAKAVNPALAQEIESTLVSGSVTTESDTNTEDATMSIPTESLSLEEAVDALDGQMWGVPFGDLSQEQRQTWQANGITWSVRWKSNGQLNAAVEELIATMQILALHLAQRDAHLVRADISLEVILGDVEMPSVAPSVEIPGELRVVLPRELDTEQHPLDHSSLMLGLAAQLARFASLLPESQYVVLMRDLGSQRELLSDPYGPLPYRRLYGEIVDGGEPIVPIEFEYETPEALQPLVGSRKVHPDMDWQDTELTEFDEQEAKARITRRYAKIPGSIPRTLERLNASPEFAEVVASLREQGWKDWHILLAIKNVAVNYWINHADQQIDLGSMGVESATAHVKAAVESGEWDANYAVPVSEFTEKYLLAAIELVGLTNELPSLGLEPSSRVDPASVGEFLARRVKYWDLDVPHDLFFSPSPSDSDQITQPPS